MEALKILERPSEITWNYDEEADVLYISIGEPRPALDVDIGEGVVLRYDEANPWIQNRINSSRGSGRSLDSPTRRFMGNRMQTDFSRVNIHTGDEAVQMNRELGARAFTVGSDIYFNEGEY